MIPARAKIAAAVIVAFGLFAAGYRVAAWKYGETLAELRLSYSEAENKALRASQSATRLAGELEAERSREREIEYRTINKEVIRYVQSPDAGRCELPTDWVRIHNSAARGTSASQPDD